MSGMETSDMVLTMLIMPSIAIGGTVTSTLTDTDGKNDLPVKREREVGWLVIGSG